VTGLRIGVLGASRIAETAMISPAAALGHRIVAADISVGHAFPSQ